MLFPHIDPVAIKIGPLAIRWYGLAYVVGFLWVQWLGKRRLMHAEQTPGMMQAKHFEDLMFWCMIGVLLGGRVGYMMFYQTTALWQAPFEIFYIWHGGMSFHGGLIGVLCAIHLFAKKHQLHRLRLLDFLAPMVPIGLGLGRLANFINGELWGRPTHGHWGMIFPWVDQQLRHPSQLYECALEGVLLFFVLRWLQRFDCSHTPGFMTGSFAMLYGLFRFLVEFYRQPDAQLGLFFGHLWSMGQLLSLPMMGFGVWLVYIGQQHKCKESSQ